MVPLALRVVLSALVVSALLTYAWEQRWSLSTSPIIFGGGHKAVPPGNGTAPDDTLAPAIPTIPSGVAPTAAMTFAYRTSHTALPLSNDVMVRLSFADDVLEPADQSSGLAQLDKALQPSRRDLCSHAAVVARANGLPIPFFANLIWQESNFNFKVVSRVGAQGIAQFMPATAVEFGLLNPFDPVHALSAAGSFLRKLYRSFGKLGLAAAAYNAGPQRLRDWMANRGPLPDETRNYVLRITSRSVDDWLQIKVGSGDILMPPSAPCAEAVEAFKEQWAAMQITDREFADAPIQLANGKRTLKRLRSQRSRERH
jgi:hypothetical protein